MNRNDFTEHKNSLIAIVEKIEFLQNNLKQSKKNEKLLLGMLKYAHLKRIALNENNKTSVINHVSGETLPLTTLMIQIEEKLKQYNKDEREIRKSTKKGQMNKKLQEIFERKSKLEGTITKVYLELDTLLKEEPSSH